MSLLATFSHCVRCGAEKVLPTIAAKKTKPTQRRRPASAYVSPLTYQIDPYCKRTCCENDRLAPERPWFADATVKGEA